MKRRKYIKNKTTTRKSRQTHIIAQIISMLGMENFRSVPDIATNAFQPVEVILVHNLQN